MSVLRSIERFFSSWRFPAWVVSLLGAYELALVVAMLLPTGGDALGQFALEFKTWCFGLDPATGRMEPMLVAMMMGEPIGLAAVIAAVWWRPLREGVTARRLLAPVLSALLVVSGGGVAFGLLHEPETAPELLPFPGERLRTELPPPPLSLTDHEGRPVDLAELRGRVVLLTSVYASCSQACPMILAQTKRAVNALTDDERARLTVIAVTLDPSHDDQAVLAKLAAAQGVKAPLYRLVTGEPARVEATLDAMGIARSRDEKTGVINHANVFLVIDAGGKVAYRFSLGKQQEAWLGAALKRLIVEAATVGA